MRRCNISFESKYAKLNGKQINIDDYLAGKCESNGTLYCIPNNHELISVNSSQRRVHFRHKHKGDLEGHPMTPWHIEWQSNFPDTEVEFKHKVGQLRDRRADTVLYTSKEILEFQHSQIRSGEVNERIKDYSLHAFFVKWIVDGQNCIEVKTMGERRILQFTSNYWLFQSFLECDTVYYDIDGFIYQVQPKLVKSYQVDVSEPKPKSEFIDALKKNINLWENEAPPQCFLYFKQQGAGSGKTYGMMQMINSDPEIANYKFIVLITKQHSAVKVMYDEFMSQYKDGYLTNIEITKEYVNGKQYIVEYNHRLTEVDCIAVFGTVDSFTYSLGEAPKNVGDKFMGIIQSIRDGMIKTGYSGVMKYANVNPVLNKEMLIMIDESQDLTELYGEAFLQIVRSKYANLCVVGDRLQSLSFKDNALTFLHKAEIAGMRVIKSDITNVVRRFSDPTLIKFVNDMIPFDKYGLPPMTPAIVSEADPKALTVFSAKTVYADKEEKSDEVIKAVSEIMEYFKYEVENKNRIPEDFLIVTPTTNKNPLVEGLQTAINIYWKNLMETNVSYIENVKSKDPYWKDIDTTQYRRYAVFHKSEDGCSINTNESNNATRMVSIHSSKGDGRKVVFVIGVTQSALQLFSQVSGNIIYDSLLQVAITRQKERLYFRLEANGDNIHEKINRSVTDINVGNNSFDILKKNVRISRLADSIFKSSFDTVFKNIISTTEIPLLPDETKDEKLLIDLGDHNIRYGSMFMNIIIHCCNYELNTPSDSKKQFFAILNKLKPNIIKIVSGWKEHMTILQDNSNHDDIKKVKINYIPVLKFPENRDNKDYQLYFTIIHSTILRVIKELEDLGKKHLHYFCPFESVVLYYMIESIENGKYQSISIDSLYNLVDIYRNVFDSRTTGHEYCECNKHFTKINTKMSELQSKYHDYLCNHYERLSHVNHLLDNLSSTYKNISWLYSHQIALDNNSYFKLYKFSDMIGYNDSIVMNLYIKPQINELNFNEFLVNSLLDTFVIMNLSKESANFTKFGNKKIISCIVSLNKDALYKIDWTIAVRENEQFLKELIYTKLFEMFNIKHLQYYGTFININKTMENVEKQKIVEHCENKFKEEIYPDYLYKAWNSISDKLEECEDDEREELFASFLEKDKFIKLFDSKLKISLKSFLEMK
jgi:hypothetical protein